MVIAGSWLSDIATFPVGSAVPVQITKSDAYKRFFIDVTGHVRKKEGTRIERSTLFRLNPLVNAHTLLKAEGEQQGLHVITEEVSDLRVNWRSVILYTGLWFLALTGFYWFMGEGPFRLRSLKLPRDPRHPSWVVIKMFLAGGVLTAILALSASSFDSTEVISIGTFLLAGFGIDGVHLARLRKLCEELDPGAAKRDNLRRIDTAA